MEPRPDNAALHDPWLVAVWPGMGSVAMLAGRYLLQHLPGCRCAGELDPRPFFDVTAVQVRDGVAAPAQLPRSLFYEWRDPGGGRDLLVFVGEAQPAARGYALCRELLEYAAGRGARRFFTFAALATQLHLASEPRVFAVATDPGTLRQVCAAGPTEVLTEGQIGGLNGVLLAAGAERGLRGACLMGELPFFAAGVPNPRAAAAVLGRFLALAEIGIDLAPLERQARDVEQHLLRLLQQMEQAARNAVLEGGDEEAPEHTGEDTDDDSGAEGTEPGDRPEWKADEEAAGPDRAGGGEAGGRPPAPRVDRRTRLRIEALFERARQDRARAFDLKRELDRLGLFKQYEDRFLDLFRHAE